MRDRGASIPALTKALTKERTSDRKSDYCAAFRVALEAIPAAAFLLTPTGVVKHANGAGRALQRRERRTLANALIRSLSVPSPMFALATIACSDNPDHYLAVMRNVAPGPGEQVSAAARRWSLSPRQYEVLLLLARGHTNKTIARLLGRAEVTIELHVSALLAKSGCATRVALIALLLTT